jgi:hypothetical protein
MSQVQAMPAAARPSLWQRIVTTTGEPPAWALVRYLAAGLVAGIAVGATLPHFKATVLAALAGAVVGACGSVGPSAIARQLAVVAAGWTLILSVVGFATGGHPVWAALAMAAVAVLTSVGAAAGPGGRRARLPAVARVSARGGDVAYQGAVRRRLAVVGHRAHRGRLRRRPGRRVRGHGLARWSRPTCCGRETGRRPKAPPLAP